MNLTIIKQREFNSVVCDFWQNEAGEIFMTREQIGQALEYSEPRKAIAKIHERNKRRLDKYSSVVNLTTGAGLRETVIYSAKGIYEICRWSKQSKADEFYDFVYDLLEVLRKGELKITEHQQLPSDPITLALEAALETRKTVQTIQSEVEVVKADVEDLKDNLVISSAQAKALRYKAHEKVSEALGGKDSNAYKKMRNKTYSACWREFWNYFNINEYRELPKTKFEEGMKFLLSWQPSTTLRMEIEQCNTQIEMNLNQ